MKTIELNFPDSIEIDNKELSIFIIAKLFEAGKISIGQAAEMAGVSLSDFMDTLFEYNISIFNYSASELASDVKNAEESIR